VASQSIGLKQSCNGHQFPANYNFLSSPGQGVAVCFDITGELVQVIKTAVTDAVADTDSQVHSFDQTEFGHLIGIAEAMAYVKKAVAQ
jgi:hypothetical protein